MEKTGFLQPEGTGHDADLDATPARRPRTSARARVAACVVLFIVVINLLSRPISFCAHRIHKAFPGRAPLTIDERVKEILTHTPLIGKQTLVSHFT